MISQTGIRLARSGQAALSLSVGRELRRRDATRRAGDRRAAAIQQRARGVASGGVTLHHRILPRQETRGAAVYGGAVAHDNPHHQPGLQLQARVLQAADRVRQHDPRQADELQRRSHRRGRSHHGARSLRHTGSLAKPRQRAHSRAAALEETDFTSKK